MRTETRHARACVRALELLSWLVGPIVLGAVLASSAKAWSYESVVSDGCHERITTEALRRVRAELGLPAIEPTTDERVLIGELPFHLDGDMREMAGASILVGVRHNDLKGHGSRAVDELALIHGDPELQDEHCLRRTEHDGANGIEAALADCRTYVRDSALHAISGGVSPDHGLPNPGARTTVAVNLAFAGTVDTQLPIAYVYLGQALHALQDSFTHAYRTADGRRVTVLLNWVDFVDHEHDERRDGPAHQAALDRCEGVDTFREERFQMAVDASADLLRAALDPGLPAAERALAVESVLDEWLSYEPGCNLDNRWCDAPERRYQDAALCSAAGAPGTRAVAQGPVLISLLLLVIGVARRPRLRWTFVLGMLLIPLGSPNAAAAQEPAALQHAVSRALPEEASEGTEEAGSAALHLAIGGAVDNGGLAASVGARLWLDDAWLLGVDAEVNPWLSVDTQKLRWGTFQAYATVVRRYEVSTSVTLRTTGQVGVSTLLFDVYGVDGGGLGLYLGLSLIGVELALGDRLSLIVEPAHVAMPVPQLSGAPFAYRQYRFTSALQWTLGA